MARQLQSEVNLPRIATVRLHCLCAFFAIASFVWGYNIGALTSIYVHPGFLKALHKPSPSTKGLITAIYYVGTWTSYVFLSHPIADYFGRKWAAWMGMLVTCCGSAFMAGAGSNGTNAKAMMVIGRLICGLGVAVVSTSVPLYQSEISPARQRGRYVVMNHIGLTTGLAIAFWVGYGVANWESRHGTYVGWRLSVAVQLIPAAIFLAGAPFVHETPRWLLAHNRPEEARASLAYLRGLPADSIEVKSEMDDIRHDLAIHTPPAGVKGYTILVTNKALFSRLWRTALLHFMAQLCGNTSIKYYLAGIFIDLGLSRKIALMVGGIESTLKIGCTIADMLLVDKIGRRYTLLLGIGIMVFSLMINGALPLAYPDNINRAADWACIMFIFFYTFAYSISFGPAPWVFGSEVFPTTFRARGLNLAASGGSIGSIITSQVWPIALSQVGSKTYFAFMSFNLVSGVIIYFFYPETKRRALEDMDDLFGDDAERAAAGVRRERNGSKGEDSANAEPVNVKGKGQS